MIHELKTPNKKIQTSGLGSFSSRENLDNITKNPVRKRTGMEELNELQIDKSKNEIASLLTSVQKEEKTASGGIPQLVKYKLNPKSDEYSKWRVIKSQYMKLYPKETSNTGFGETKRRSQTAISKQSIANNSPDKGLLNSNNKERTPTLFDKINTLTPSNKVNVNNNNNDSLQSIKENFKTNELGIPTIGKISRANTTNAYELISAIDATKNEPKTKSTIFKNNFEKNTNNEKNEPSFLDNILQNRNKEKIREREEANLKNNINTTPMKTSTFGGNNPEIIKLPISTTSAEKNVKLEDMNIFNFKKPNYNKSYIEEYLKKIHFTGKKEAFEISNDFMNEEDQEIDREIHQYQKKLTDTMEHIKSLGFRKTKRHVKDPSESRYIDQLLDILTDQEPILTKLIIRDQEKLEMKNEIRTLRSLIETCIKTNDDKTKEHEKEVKSLRDLIENFNENRVFSLEMENKKLKDEVERLKRENNDIQELLDKKSKELSFLYADAENTKESIITELKNLKELKDRLNQEKQRMDQEKREFNISAPDSPEKDKKQAFIINETGKKLENKSNINNNSKSKFNKSEDIDNGTVNGRFSKFTAEILADNKPFGEQSGKKSNLNSQPILLKDLKDPPSSKGLFYQDITTSEKLKPGFILSRTNSNISSTEEIDEQGIGLQRLRTMIQTIKAGQEKLVLESDQLYNEKVQQQDNNVYYSD